MEVLQIDRWTAPAELEENQVGEWRITHARKAPGFYPMHKTLGCDAVQFKKLGEITLLQERRQRRWRDWMTDDPLFWYAMWEYANRMSGSILIGGLGLGLIIRHLMENMIANKVTVIERQQEVIDLVWNQIAPPSNFNLVKADFFDLPDDLKSQEFDTTLTDFWVGSPHDLEVQSIFLDTFETVNTYWPSAKQLYHGVMPWASALGKLWKNGTYQNLGRPEKLLILKELTASTNR